MVHPAEPAIETKASKSRAVLAAGGVGLMVFAAGALGFASSNSDAMISAGFDRAFAALAPSGGETVAIPAAPDKTEDEWLRVSAMNPDVIKAVAIGKEIRLIGAGTARTLRIVDVADLGDAATHIDTSATAARVLLVTCREGDDTAGTEYRIRIEGGFIRDIAIAERPHSL